MLNVDKSFLTVIMISFKWRRDVFMKSIIHIVNKYFLIINLIYICCASVAYSQEDIYLSPDVNIISVTPVQGSGISLDRVPSNIQIIRKSDLDEKKNFSVVETLNRKAAGISISNSIAHQCKMILIFGDM